MYYTQNIKRAQTVIELNSKGKKRQQFYTHPGRPYKDDDERLLRGINIRLNRIEHAELKEYCFKDGQSMTDVGRMYLRRHLVKLRKKYGGEE